MLEVIVDTNVIINAVLNQLKNEDCFEILKLIRINKIITVVSRQLLREYYFGTTKVVILKLAKKLSEKGYNQEIVDDSLKESFNCASVIMEIMEVCKKVKVTSKERVCLLDPDDDKIANLAIDSNCPIIITKNKSDFSLIEDKNVKTRNGRQILVYSPEEFIDYYYNTYIKLKQFEKNTKF